MQGVRVVVISSVDSVYGFGMSGSVSCFSVGFVVKKYLSDIAAHITTVMGTYAHSLPLSNSWAAGRIT